MKILLFTDTLCDLNGVSRFLQDMSHIADSQKVGLHIHTATYKRCNIANDHLHIHSPRYRIKMPFYPQLDLTYLPPKTIGKIIDREKPDIVHISTPGPIGWSAKKEAKKRGIPLAATYHTDFPSYLYDKTKSKGVHKITQSLMRHFYRDFDLLLTRSNLYRQTLTTTLGINPDTIHTLKAGIDLSRFHPDCKRSMRWEDFGLSHDGLKILYVGRLSEEKRISLLLQAWQQAQKRCNASLVLVGEGNQKILKSVVNIPGVIHLGKRVGLELSFIYAASDLFVTPSLTETLGQTILEAMASSLPIIVADRGGHREFVKERFASIVSEDDPKAWADAIVELCKNEKDRIAKGATARQKALAMSIDKSFEDFIKIHKEALG